MPENRKVFHDSVVPIPVGSGPAPHGLVVNAAVAAAQDQRMTLHFSLALPEAAQAKLEAAVAQGLPISPKDLINRYGAKKSDTNALVKWLEKHGFTVEEISSDGASVYANAPVSDIQRSLDVQMVRVNKGGFTYTASRNAPSLPVSVGDPVQAIGGLQPFRQARKHSKRREPRDSNRRGLGSNGGAAHPSPNIANAPPYLPAEMRKAYNADDAALDGSGQTIGILIDTVPSDSDMETFWKQANLSTTITQIQKINVDGGALPPPEGEETLDAQWTSGIAPGATVRIYATGSLEFTALDRIIADLADHPEMRQVSISLGLGERYLNGPGGEVAIEHQKFSQLAAAGVNVFVSSGDGGSNPDDSGHSQTGPTQAEFQASDPYVIAVGGTSVTLDPTGAVAGEMGWASSGGGKSMYFPRPPWQSGTGIGGARRLVPDVSAPADPEEGGLVILNGHVRQYGGTSWSAPMWAGFCALINEARLKAGKPPLPFLGPLLYPLAGTACFRDIKSGINGAYHATVGFDLVTGLGVPDVAELITALP